MSLLHLNFVRFSFAVAMLSFCSMSFADEFNWKTDWPSWRGPTGDGHANPDQEPVVKWSDSENVLWSVNVPGRGHGSPTVAGNKVFLATADPKTGSQSVLCYDFSTGKEIFNTTVHESGAMVKNKKASAASTSPLCDGERVYVGFPNSGSLIASALDMNGKVLWQTKISPYIVHQGYGGSASLYKNLVIIASDNKAGGAVAALNPKTGEIVWKNDRPKKPNYASPVVVKADEKEQLVITGCDLVTSYDPTTGKKLWEVEGATTECVTTTVTDGKHVYSSGGYPKNHVAAYLADGSGKKVWESKTRVYVPSMLMKDGYLYAVADAGVAVCFNAATGEEMWKKRLGGTFSASLVLVKDNLYAVNEAGKSFIFKASPEGYESVGVNQLGDETFATPTICHSKILIRIADRENGKRQEKLYCIGVK